MSNFEKWLCKIENVSFYAKIIDKKILNDPIWMLLSDHFS